MGGCGGVGWLAFSHCDKVLEKTGFKKRKDLCELTV